METIEKINENLSIKKVTTHITTTISIIEDEIETVLKRMGTNYAFSCNYIYNNDYIVVYSRGSMANQIPLEIETVYDIKNKECIEPLTPEIKNAIEYMLVCRKTLDMNAVLLVLNKTDLGNLNQENTEKVNKLINYLTSGNEDISIEQIKEYILKEKPELKEYTNLEGHMNIEKFIELLNKVNSIDLFIHSIPQDINYLKKGNAMIKKIEN